MLVAFVFNPLLHFNLKQSNQYDKKFQTKICIEVSFALCNKMNPFEIKDFRIFLVEPPATVEQIDAEG